MHVGHNMASAGIGRFGDAGICMPTIADFTGDNTCRPFERIF
jgi:hypothetical protein